MKLLLLLPFLCGCSAVHPNQKMTWTSIGTLHLFNGTDYDVLQGQLWVAKDTNFFNLRYQQVPSAIMPQMQRGSPPIDLNTVPVPPLLPPQRQKE